MSYTPTNWQCGDTITAEKLNKLENGLAECCSGGGTTLGMVCIEAVPIAVPTEDGTEQSSVVYAYRQSGPSSVSGESYIVISDADFQAIANGDIRAACIRFEFNQDGVDRTKWLYLNEYDDSEFGVMTANGVSGFYGGVTFVNDGYAIPAAINAYLSDSLSALHYVVPPSIADALVYVAGQGGGDLLP